MAADAPAPDKPPPFDASEMLGKELDGRYRLEDLLGFGGMGMVFRATQMAVGREVAIKTLNPGLASAPQFFERFKREAETASRLKHPNIVTIFDFGKAADGTCYIAMELLEGESLRQMVKNQGPMSLRRAVAVTEQIALGLQHAHNHHMVHRDMKPHNVIVTSVDGNEYVKVLDFGLVKAGEGEEEEQLTSTGQVLGTPQYMAPEQASGEPVDARTDLYSLGGVLHYCLTGQSPYNANSVRKALTAALTQPVPSVASKRRGAPVPHSIENFLRKALAKEPEDRYQSAEEFINDLEASLKGVSDAELDALPERPDGEPPKETGSGSGKKGSASSVGKSRSRPLPKSQDSKVMGKPTVGDLPSLKGDGGGMPMIAKLAIIILPLAGLGGAGVAFLLKEKPPAPVVEQPVQPTQPTKVADKGNTPPPAAEEITVTLKTTPPGAAVLEDGVMIGKTPLEQRWAKSGVRKLTFQLNGYKDLQRAVRLDHDDTVEVELEPAGPRKTGKTGKKDSNISAFE